LGYNLMEEACTMVRERISEVPEIALVLGSGLGNIADKLTNKISIPYREIPGFPESTAPGHASRLICGRLEETRVLIFQGRFHHYEGYTLDQIAYPVKFLKKLGCRTLVLTNAAGGVNRSFQPGDLMLITGHINTVGKNPLMGKNDEFFGPRFPDLSGAYSRELKDLMLNAAGQLDISLKEGVYAWVSGPSFETPSEIRMLDILGADAVGMSTVPEVITASHAGLEVLGISCISNMAAGILDQPITGEEVLQIGRQVTEKFTSLICRFVSLCSNRR